MKYRYYKKTRRPKIVVLRSKVKKERKRKIGKLLIVSVLLAVGAVATLASYKKVCEYFLTSDNFAIRRIEVLGCRNVSKSEILSLLPFRQGDNLLSIRPRAAEIEIGKVKPELKKISITCSWQKVSVRIAERDPVGWVNQNGVKLGLDADNKLFPLRGKLNEALLAEVAGKSPQDRKEILSFMRHFEKDAGVLYKEILKFDLESLNDISMQIKDGPRVLWGGHEKEFIKEKLQILGRVMDDSKKRFHGVEYVNLCFFDQGRIIVKPKVPQAAR